MLIIIRRLIFIKGSVVARDTSDGRLSRPLVRTISQRVRGEKVVAFTRPRSSLRHRRGVNAEACPEEQSLSSRVPSVSSVEMVDATRTFLVPRQAEQVGPHTGTLDGEGDEPVCLGGGNVTIKDPSL